jgi:hypothetical protein
MKLYYPVYTNKWEVHTIESENLGFLHHSYNEHCDVYCHVRIIDGRKYKYGELIYSNRLYMYECSAWAYINRQYSVADLGLYLNRER